MTKTALDPAATPPAATPPASPPPAAPITPSPAVPELAPTSVAIHTPGRVAGAIAQLAVVGLVWPWLFAMLGMLLGPGIGLLLALGIGILFLVALVYGLFAFSWLETARIEGLYGFGLAPRRPRASGRSGFLGLLHTVWLQAIDGAMWRAIAHAAIAGVLGWGVLTLLTVFGSGVMLAFAPLFAQPGSSIRLARTGFDVPLEWAIVAGIIAAIASAAAIIGIALLHGVIARAILVPSREAQLAEQARSWQQQRGGAVRAADVERTRIERDLHDGIQPRLVSVGMTLGLAQQKIDSDPQTAKALIAEAHASTKAAITELRQLARGIHTSILDDRGLDAALSALAARSPVPVSLDVRLTGRCSTSAETAVYFVIAESLTNAAKHSRAAECRVLVREREGGVLWARVEDNGIGGAHIVPGGGLDGLSNRVLGAGGTLRVDSPAGGPTTVEVSVPCAS